MKCTRNKKEYVLNGYVTGKKKITRSWVELTPSHKEELKTCPIPKMSARRHPRKGWSAAILYYWKISNDANKRKQRFLQAPSRRVSFWSAQSLRPHHSGGVTVLRKMWVQSWAFSCCEENQLPVPESPCPLSFPPLPKSSSSILHPSRGPELLWKTR